MEMLTRSSASFIEMATIRPSSARPKHSHDADRKDIERTFSVTQHDPFSLTRALVDERVIVDRKPVKKFYVAQNEKIKGMLKSVDQHVGNEYLRVRFGIGRPQLPVSVADFVLQDFSNQEQLVVTDKLATVVDNLNLLVQGSLEKFKKQIA